MQEVMQARYVNSTNSYIGQIVALIVYVGDMIVTGDYTDEIKRLKRALAEKFEINDLGDLKVGM